MASKKLNPSLVATRTILDGFAQAHNLEGQAGAKRAESVNAAIAVLVDAGVLLAPALETMRAAFETAVSAGTLSQGSIKPYMSGVNFAMSHGVEWSTNLHSRDHQVKALEAAGITLPKALQAHKEKADVASATDKSTTKASKTHVADKASVVKHLAAALADARTMGKADWIADITDCIHAVDPTWKEPAAK